ncbi:MAG: hypothetical protein II786_03565 [Muribaculaceae bacterium]|nr:hypothetical protein [Muribaculaceae bacterium]
MGRQRVGRLSGHWSTPKSRNVRGAGVVGSGLRSLSCSRITSMALSSCWSGQLQQEKIVNLIMAWIDEQMKMDQKKQIEI